MEGLIYLLPLLLLVLGYFAGSIAESRHYASIKEREARCLTVPTITSNDYDRSRPIAAAQLCVGSVVVSVDYFKRFLSSFRMIFGGEMHAYSSLIDRGRREALLRMKEQSPGADIFINCRIETSAISQGQGKTLGTVEVLAFATAIKYQSEVRP
jgi:uncharacterized protein YbjQ (UPF0145 family)